MLYLEYYIFQVLFPLYLYVCLYARGYVMLVCRYSWGLKRVSDPPEAGVIDAYKGVVNQTHNAGSKQA